jgi:hypothetical protein
MSLHDARRQSITRCSTAGERQKDAPRQSGSLPTSLTS